MTFSFIGAALRPPDAHAIVLPCQLERFLRGDEVTLGAFR
jgi:hypothetical protein